MQKRVISIGAAIAALALSVTSQGAELFKARLTGDQEVPPVATETTGRFEILVNDARTAGEYTLRIESGMRVTQAHFHCGAARANGPVIVFLAGNHPNGWNVDGKWVSNATITDANVVNPACGATLNEIFENARLGGVYVNAHSVSNPAGIVRGQLLPADGE
jgi:hypothetical protein